MQNWKNKIRKMKKKLLLIIHLSLFDFIFIHFALIFAFSLYYLIP